MQLYLRSTKHNMALADLYTLKGEIAMVTGAGAGIGRAIATTFAEAGAAVVVSDLHIDTAEAVAQEIRAAGGQAIAAQCNVTEEADLVALADGAERAFGGITVLVNNAGGGGPKPFDMPIETFIGQFRLNLFSVMRLCQLCTPHMAKAGHGAILNISSMSGENKNIHMAAYGASKAAVNHLTRNIAYDLGPMNIRVNAIAPGAIHTAALARVLTPQIEAAMLAKTPIKRLGQPEDIARAALFLCSPAAAWISGQVLTVSGGGVQELD